MRQQEAPRTGAVARSVGDRVPQGALVTIGGSSGDARQEIVRLTPRAVDYLAAQRKAARAIERQLHAKIGRERTENLYAVLEALGGAEEMRMRDYLRKMGIREV